MVPHCPPPDVQGQAFPLKSFISIREDFILSQMLHYTPDRGEQVGGIGLCCCKFEHIEKAQNVSNAGIFVKKENKGHRTKDSSYSYRALVDSITIFFYH